MNSICLTADQAKEIVENRRLELFSPCEWQPPSGAEIYINKHGQVEWSTGHEGVGWNHGKETLTPQHQIGDVVLVKEPFWYEVAMGEPKTPTDNHMFYAANSDDINNPTVPWFPAHDLPIHLVRTKAKATEIELQLHEGKLRWREVWEVVEEQG